MKCNLGRMPTLETAQGSIGQSAAINYYVAGQNNLLGDNLFESAKIMELQANIADLKTTWYGLVPYGSTPTEEQLTQWFDSGVTETDGPAQGRGERFLQWFAGRINASLEGKDGFAVGNRLSLADVLLYNCFEEHLTDGEGDGKNDAFTSLARTRAVVEKCPAIKASIEKVKAHANVQKWLSTRGPQGF